MMTDLLLACLSEFQRRVNRTVLCWMFEVAHPSRRAVRYDGIVRSLVSNKK